MPVSQQAPHLTEAGKQIETEWSLSKLLWALDELAQALEFLGLGA